MTKSDILERSYNHPCEDNSDYGPLLCGLRVEAMEEIKTLRARISALEGVEHYSDCPVNNAPALPVGKCDCLDKARADIVKLRAALKPFSSLLNDEGDYIVASPSLSDLRAARAALEKK